MRHLLRDIAEISSGQGAPQGDSCYCEDGIPFVKAGNMENLVSGGSITAIQKVSQENAKSYKLKLYPKGTVLFAKSGMSCLKGYVYVLPQEAYVVSHLACISPKGDYSDFLRYYFNYHKPNQLVKDEAYPSISLADIGEMEIDIKDINTRASIVSVLDKVEQLISLRKKQLQKLNDLVKSRFVEMFGDPVTNPKGWEKHPLSDEAEIKIGPFGSLLHKDDYISGGHALVNPSHIVDGAIIPAEDLTVSDEKYKELNAYHLLEGDVVMGRRGEMGRCAVVDRSGLLCGTGSLLIRSKGDLSADFIQKIISFPSFKKTIEEMAVGQTMPNLNVPIVSSFQIIKPPKSVQDDYYTFVAQIDETRLTEQRGLDKLELLKHSLMQKYFG